MRIVGQSRLEEFCKKYADTRQWIENWLADTRVASWQTSHGIKAAYASASFLGGNTVIFNVKGNDYRLEVTVAYKTGTVVVLWIGTHSRYGQRNSKRR